MKLKKYSSSGGLQGRRVRALERLKKQESLLILDSTNKLIIKKYAKKLKRIDKELEILTKRVIRGMSHGN